MRYISEEFEGNVKEICEKCEKNLRKNSTEIWGKI